ncbi:uncharacterized protein IL334_000845 [Kwoniella shivajii]|uniref:Mif2/CENP-C cupin domain-containing protein n=1 Tax=Kwoniella shivajii TaxID=564305 RepID=A0ABZ1CQH4_9TREE|nr:hypothetical protein IL334_000845 [Kwoniella shivajii]
MSQRTPGRAKRGEERHVPYNADPKTVGTYTNAPMPKDVRRLDDGFEDPAAFFQSPGTEIGQNRTISSMLSSANNRTPRTPGARSDYTTANTPMTGMTGMTTGHSSIGTIRRSKHRLSDLDVNPDDEEDTENILLNDDLLVDEDDLTPATPGLQYFQQGKNPPSVSFPALSRVPASSPAVDLSFDAIPSPQTSKTVARSPRKSTVTVLSKSTSSRLTRGRISDLTEGNSTRHMDSFEDITQEDLNFNTSFASQAVIDDSPSKNTRNNPRTSDSPITNKKIQNGRKSKVVNSQPALEETEDVSFDQPDYAEDVGQAEKSPDNQKRKSKSATSTRKSNVNRDETMNRDESVSDNEGGMDGFDDTVQDVSLGNDDNDLQNGDDVSALADDMASGDDDDLAMEEAAIAEEEEEEEEEIEEGRDSRDQVKNKGGRPKKVVREKKRNDNTAPARTRNERQGSVAAKPRKTRISQIGVDGEGSDDDLDGYHGNFQTRRSNRQHFKPLEWWRGEKFEYQRGHLLPVIKEVVTYPEAQHDPLSHSKTRRRGKSRPRSASAAPVKKRKEREESIIDENGWDAQTEPTGVVKAYPGGWEAHRKIACPKALLTVPEPSKNNQSFRYQKVFGEGDFMAAGVVFIPVGSKKAPKPSKDNAYVFYVIQGAVQVTIYRTSFVMAPGGQFLVPRGNDYCIENISPDREVQLFFAQARKIRAGEEEMIEQPPAGYMENGRRASSIASSAAPASMKKKKKLPNVREESVSASESG